MNNNNESYELEEMRQQITLLKEKLDKEKVVNEKLFTSTMKSHFIFLRSINIFNIITEVLILFLIPVLFYKIVNLSLPLCIYTAVIIMLDILFSLYSNIYISSTIRKNQDLITTDENIQKYIKIKNYSVIYGIIALIVFYTWFTLEIGFNDSKLPIILAIVLLGVNFYIFNRIISRTKKLCEDIKQIQELRGE